MNLSLCVIARNEDTALPVMLKSAAPICDEIIICDTGSTDATKEVASRYTDKVFDIPWENSFAKARNASLEKATGDWILILDCDETLEEATRDNIRKVCESVPDDIELVLIPLVMCRDDGSPFQQFLAERLIRNGRGVRFEGDMHNWVNVPVDRGRAAIECAKILHNRAVKTQEGRESRAKQRVEMAEAIFVPKIEADPKDRRSIFYLAGTYFDAGMLDKAIPIFEQYLAVSDWGAERYQAALLLSQAYRDRGLREKARSVLAASIADNWQRGENFVALGEMAMEDKDYRQAEFYFKTASLKPMPLDPLFVEVDAHTWAPHFGLFECYQSLGDSARAIQHAEHAEKMGCPRTLDTVRYRKNHTLYGSDNILALVDRGQMDFIDPLLEHWRESGKTVHIRQTVEECLHRELGVGQSSCEWADIIFCEWAGPEAIKLTHQQKTARIVVRVHGYELHSGYIEQVNWANVDDVIFVADYLRDLAIQQCPEIVRLTNIYVVPGGVQTDKFSICTEKTGKRIAMACFGNQKKGFPLALQILAQCPDHELHIATQWQDHRLAMYVDHMIEELGLRDRVFFHDWQDDLNAFYADKDFYLSASEEESFHYALAEAMAAGLKPVIHAWKSARDWYEDEWIFTTVDEAVSMLADAGDPQVYRTYAVEHLDVSTNIRRIDRILTKPSVAVYGEPKYPYALEYQLTHALQALGCRTDAPDVDLAVLTGHSPRVADAANAKIKALWHVELLVGNSDHAQVKREQIADIVPNVDVAITAHPQATGELEALGAKRTLHICAYGAAWPYCKLDMPKVHDIGFCGAITPYRQFVLDELSKEFSIVILDNYDAEQINAFYNSCRVVLNIHANEEPELQQRIADAMAAGACVVTQTLPEGSPYPKDCMIESSDLSRALGTALADPELCGDIGKRAHRWVWRHFRLTHAAEQLLEAVGL